MSWGYAGKAPTRIKVKGKETYLANSCKQHNLISIIKVKGDIWEC